MEGKRSLSLCRVGISVKDGIQPCGINIMKNREYYVALMLK